MKDLSLIIGLAACSFPAPAQTLEARAAELAALIRQVAAETDSARKTAAMTAFADAFAETLRRENAMDFAFDSIPYMGTLVSPDRKARMFTWNLPLNAGRHRYYGIVQYRIGKAVRTTVLHDVKDSLTVRAERATLLNGDWFGALYYELLQNKSGTQVYYTLLGYDFHAGATHRKLIDVLTFDGQGLPAFGAPLFDNGRWKASRVLLEYSAATPFYLNYARRKKMILFQRLELAPLGDLPGRVPSGAFDGLLFRDGGWTLQKDVAVTPDDFKR
ncbi:MAG: hypothetical protein LBI89_01050 [Prevotellaceae bacterium]|jgi:hypothetical protein|nr:hypothetical protein [Prevotellaceae bacterium]